MVGEFIRFRRRSGRVTGREVVAIRNGKLDFGPREQIYFGRRPKRVLVKVIGE